MSNKDFVEEKVTQKELAKKFAKELRDELTEQWRKRDYGLKKRENTIMTRISHEDLQFLEALVELEIFKSISETAAFLIHDSIVKQRQHYERILKIAEEIKRKKLEAVRTLLGATKEVEEQEGEKVETPVPEMEENKEAEKLVKDESGKKK
ncbi:MAG: hypothetical protein RBG13Loki_3142 [Promethearchaeota archaeon CR_4]|nr:MAG: hypothetical protein RBG13Loki_3142 [Candidatus Lokiarchaeota archaeon CR_4]